jgi:hypothetical protein
MLRCVFVASRQSSRILKIVIAGLDPAIHRSA